MARQTQPVQRVRGRPVSCQSARVARLERKAYGITLSDEEIDQMTSTEGQER